MPTNTISFADGPIIRYRYAADGRKLQTAYVLDNMGFIDPADDSPAGHAMVAGLLGSGLVPGGPDPEPVDTTTYFPGEVTLMTRDYCGSVIYRDGALERIMGDYGYMDGEGGLHYYIKDYQGNVRAVIDGQGALEEVNNYYPYGALLGGGTLGGNQGVQPYKYGAKELDRQNGLDWYDSQARHYDPLIGCTPTMDPKAEDYTPISPYAWSAGNPILLSDPTGEEWIISTRSDQKLVHVNNRFDFSIGL